MPKGIVVSFERNSGFGFIETEKGERVFVHHSGIGDADRKYLVAGQHVEFQISTTERGVRAEEVHVLREVSLKSQRNLDWRHRRGKRPRPGELPVPRTPAEAAQSADEDEEEGVLHARRHSAPAPMPHPTKGDA